MSEASLAAQVIIYQRLTGTSAITDLVPAESIFDRNERPETFPCIVVGEAQTVGDDTDCGPSSDVFSTIHVWTKEDSTKACKTIAGAVRRALWQAAGTYDGFSVIDTFFEDARFLRDPSGEHAHGVVTFLSLVSEG